MKKTWNLDEYCVSCGHLINRAKYDQYCAYMSDTGKARGCPPGLGCDKHTKLTGLIPHGRVKYIKEKIEQRDSARMAAANYRKQKEMEHAKNRESEIL